MTSMKFDTLRYARRLKEAGMPEAQADVQAELMAEAFGFYADNLLTRDHFTEVVNARFAEQDAKIEARFVEQDAKFEAKFTQLDAKFTQLKAKFTQLESKFTQLEAKFVGQGAEIEGRFGQLDAKLDRHAWMLGLIILVLVVPQLMQFFGGPP